MDNLLEYLNHPISYFDKQTAGTAYVIMYMIVGYLLALLIGWFAPDIHRFFSRMNPRD